MPSNVENNKLNILERIVMVNSSIGPATTLEIVRLPAV